MKPQILKPGEFSQHDLNEFRQNQTYNNVDIYEKQLNELAEMRYPADKQKQQEHIENSPKGDLAGVWVYYPWSGTMLHCVREEELNELRTNRNKNLISTEEQDKLFASVVGVAGMSVGSGIALGCVYSGISNTLKLTDFDELETANLNRLRESLSNVGQAKADLTARHIYELNPFAEVHNFNKGLNTDNIDDFFQTPKLDVVVDEIDDFKMKVMLRLKAKEKGVPLIMLTSLGDNILVDVERYDTDPALILFNGAVGQTPEEILQKEHISPEDVKRYAVQLVGQEYVPTKAIGSLLEIGQTLVGRPQLYSTIAADGGLAAYVIKKILLGSDIKSGRYFIKFSELFNLEPIDLADSPERHSILNELLNND